jgi:hypothetical protein
VWSLDADRVRHVLVVDESRRVHGELDQANASSVGIEHEPAEPDGRPFAFQLS